jgi:uracil-DNA glycosylase
MSIEKLNYQIYGCKQCRLWQGAKHAVPGEGPLNAKVMLVGQNPGVEEDEIGRPFVGRAGKYLTKILAENGLNREQLFITNIVKHKTPKNRAPYADEIAACLPYLIEQINIIKPEKIVLMGKTAYKTPRIYGIRYYEVIHPQAASRFPKMDKKFQNQIKSIGKKQT